MRVLRKPATKIENIMLPVWFDGFREVCTYILESTKKPPNLLAVSVCVCVTGLTTRKTHRLVT